MVSVELLPHRIAHGPWTMLRVCRVGGDNYSAGDFFGRTIETAMDSDTFCVLPCRALVRRGTRRSVHGPLHRAARKAAFKPPRPARAKRKLDHGRQYSGAYGGSVCKILRTPRRRRPGGGYYGRPITAASLYAEHHRWIL